MRIHMFRDPSKSSKLFSAPISKQRLQVHKVLVTLRSFLGICALTVKVGICSIQEDKTKSRRPWIGELAED